DCFIAFGVEKKMRDLFKTWEEKATPTIVFEITSKTTKRQDQNKKLAVYRDTWKVKEYYLFDPLEDYLKPSLQGFKRSRGQLKPLDMVDGKITSPSLQITLHRDGHQLILTDPHGNKILTQDEREAEQQRLVANQQRAIADQRSAALEQVQEELQALRAELERLRKSH
ncbi:MAG: Uma2 family endonuclease, partial [Fimbriiglobus sp.]